MQEEEKTLLIAGGGLIGLAASLLFSDRFRKVELFEKREDPILTQGKEARSLQLVLSARGWNTLNLLGFEDEIRAITLNLKGRYHHHPGSKIFEAYSPSGDTISCISRESLYRLLCAKARMNPKIRLHFQTEVSDADFMSSRIITESQISRRKEARQYDFLIGADGVRSKIAAELNPEGEDFRKESNVYREISVSTDNWERDAFHYWHTETAMIGAFPVFEGGFSLFLVHREDDSGRLLHDSGNPLFQTLFPEISSQVPGVREKFAQATGGILGSKSSSCWHYGDNVALAGDAAHAVLPFMGQGLNTGLEDLYILNRYLDRNGLIPEKKLSSYEDERRPQADAIRLISQDQFRYLTGQYGENEYRMRTAIAENLVAQGQLPTYSACAFSLEPFSSILEKEEVLRKELYSSDKS
jgi:kynurenine 3-monooxygenase